MTASRAIESSPSADLAIAAAVGADERLFPDSDIEKPFSATSPSPQTVRSIDTRI